MNYKETIAFLYTQLPVYHRIGKAAYKADLNNTIALDKYFGHPHNHFRSLHIAGTNGKGSVSHMLASILQEAGYKTGLYTSPHLKDYRERIRVNGRMIPERKVVAFVEENMKFITSLQPSFFEMSVAMAFGYFASEKVDIAVIETGLGGRLDSTNIIRPLLSVITNIGFDHMDLLGNSLEKIAWEKAGIIKKNVPVIIGEYNEETKAVFCSKAHEMWADIIFAGDMFTCSHSEMDYAGGTRTFALTKNDSGKILTGKTVLGGDYQIKNIPVVAAAVELMKPVFHVTDKHFTEGIKKVIINTGLKGRWQILDHNPLIICDTGHNEHGLVHVIRQIGNTPKHNLHMIIGFVNDKDLSLVLPLFPKDAKYYFTKASVPRALNEDTLRLKAAEYGLTGNSYPGVKAAFKAARENSGKDDLIFIGGSTFIVADIL